MASTLTVDNIVGATTAGNVKIPGTIVQVVGRTGGDRVTTSSLNTWTEANMDLTITPKFNDSQFLITAVQSMRVYGTGVTVARGSIRLKRRIGSGSYGIVFNTAGHQEMMQTRVANGVTQEFATAMPITALDGPSHNGQTVTYAVEGLTYNDTGVSQMILWEGTRGCQIQIMEIAQ
jgi:hypothetical protein